MKLLAARQPELSRTLLETIVGIADSIRHSSELSAGLSVRATDEACVYLKHPLMESEQSRMLPEVLKSAFCGRFPGKWSDVASEAGAAWAAIQKALREDRKRS